MTVRAAGGVLWRPAADGVELAVVHRARYGDWTLPKGKLEPAECELQAAVREVGEETGARVTVGRRLAKVGYQVGDEPKTVAYWAMRYSAGSFTASPEVSDLRWLPPASAAALLTYDTDRSVLASFPPVPDALVLLVRHAKAGNRSEWDGQDRARPLEPAGLDQARRLAAVLALFGPTRVLAADLVRCRQTVEPLARALATVVADAPQFADQNALDDPDGTVRALTGLAVSGTVTVVSSQGDTIPLLVRQLTGRSDARTGKGAFWALAFRQRRLVSADYYS